VASIIPIMDQNCVKFHVVAYTQITALKLYTVSQKKACDYIFCNNWNNECPIIIIFGTLINETICHRMVVSFPTSSI